MKCPKCNKEIAEGAKFCPECGCNLNEKKVCSKCGIDLSPSAKFCPQCGTPCGVSEVVAVADSDQRKDVFIITAQNLDEIMGTDFSLVSIDNVMSENEKVADVIIDDEGDVIIQGFTRGKVRIGVEFTYQDRSRNRDEATWVGVFLVKAGCEIEFQEGGFLENTEDNGNSSGNDDSWGDIISGIGAFAGGFLGGLSAAFGDDDD